MCNALPKLAVNGGVHRRIEVVDFISKFTIIHHLLLITLINTKHLELGTKSKMEYFFD